LKIVKLLFILIIICFIIFLFINRERILDIFVIKKTFWEPTEEYIERYNSYKPKSLLEQAEGKWVGRKGKQFKLVKELEIGSETDEHLRFFLPLDIEVDDFGDIYLLDSGHQRIQIFDERGDFLRSIDKNKGFPPVAVDISINSDGIIAAAEEFKKKIYLFMDSGKLLGNFSVPFEPLKVEALNNEYLVVGMGKEFLIHKYSKDGERISAFCPVLQKDETIIIKKIFNEASFNIGQKGLIYLSYEYPYKIIKFDNEGVPILAFSRKLPDDIFPPIIDEGAGGKKFDAKKRTISMEIKISQNGEIYNLIRGTETKRGNRIDKFDSNGVYLQTFYLDVPIDDFTIYGNEYIWCFLGKPENKIIKYKIERLIL